MNMRILGTVDVAAEFYIVYSTSNVPYQDWQGEFLEYTVKSSADAARCQIIRLVSHDTRADDDTYQLGSDVTFVFPSHTDRLPDGKYYAPLNKPCALGSLAAWWMNDATLDPDAVFVLVDPDMTWHAPLAPADIPARGTVNGHLWTTDGHVMYPLVIRASDLRRMSAAYLRHTIAEYERHDYQAEMHGFMEAARECGLLERVDASFGPTAGHGKFDHYAVARFLHYCQRFPISGPTQWYKQAYTAMTLRHPWERPVSSHVVEDAGQRDVLDRLHDLIAFQTRTGVRPPRIEVEAEGSLLHVYLWAPAEDEEASRDRCRWSLETARKQGLLPRLAAAGRESGDLAHGEQAAESSRFHVLRELLRGASDTRLFLLIDGLDTLVNGTEEQIVDTFLRCDTQILVSAEKTCADERREFSRKGDAAPGNYRHAGSGAIMGFAGALRRMAEQCIHDIEQGLGHHEGLIGKYVHDHCGDPRHVRLDTECRLLWVIGDDDASTFSESPFRNPYTQTTPRVLRVIGSDRQNAAIYRQVAERITTGSPHRQLSVPAIE